MTVSTAPTPLSYAGNGSTTAFPITWKYNSTTHVVATLRSSTGTETVWVVTTNYTITAAGDSGTLTAIVAPATGETLVITLEPPNTQSSDIPLGGDFPSTTIENSLDLAAQRDGKIEALFLRALRVPKTDTQTGSSLEIPIDTLRASKFLAFDASGNPIAAAGTSANLGPVTAFIDTLLDDTTEAAARTTLGAVGLTGDETIAGIKAFTGANTHSETETFTEIQNFTAGIGPNYLQNIGIAVSVSSKALTVALKTKALADASATDLIQTAFRNVTLTTGDYVVRNITAATSVVAPSGATLGFTASQTSYIYVYALDNAGTPEAALSGSNRWDEATVQSTTAISATADSSSVLYSTTSRTNVPIRYLGRIRIQTGAVAGEWDNEDTEIYVGSQITPSTSNTQTFTSSGTWVKPAGFDSTATVLVRAWGGGGGGASGVSNSLVGGGGGGGAYVEEWKILSDLGTTETVTIGAGGIAVSGNAHGNAGGNTTLGSLVTAYGGSGGASAGAGTGAGGGGGGGLTGAGASTTSDAGGVGGTPTATVSTYTYGGGTGGVSTAGNPTAGRDAINGGGGGGGGDTNGANSAGTGGNAIYGGGGGGGAGTDTAGASGGTSKYGGAGGAGAFDANNATAGTQPGGGGGGAETGTSGAGGAGKMIVTVF